MTGLSQPPKAYLSWSSGKDSAFALQEARRLGLADVVGLLTTVDEASGRVAHHGVAEELLDRQCEALGLPCLKVWLPNPCPNAVYEARLGEAAAQMKAEGAHHVVFGDLYLEDIRAYRESRLAAAGMEGLFPLWGRDTGSLAQAMIASGMVAHLACIDPRRLEAGFVGRRFDAALLADLPEGVDPCGENGEFHTVVTGGPLFGHSIAAAPVAVEERGGYVFADFRPA